MAKRRAMTQRVDLDDIAAQIHESYRTAQGSYPSFAELPEFLKEDNREAARRIGQVLALAGLRLVNRDTQGWPKKAQEEIAQVIEQNLDLLAEGEHDLWVASRLRHGWRVGDYKDADRRQHHLLVPYAQFAEQVKRNHRYQHRANPVPDLTEPEVEEKVEAEKKKDRDAVKSYVAIIAQTSYRIVRERG